MSSTNRPNQTGRLRRIALFYLALSAAASSFWTWVIWLLSDGLPGRVSVVIFLALFLLTFMVLACIAAGADADMPERNLPSQREDRP